MSSYDHYQEAKAVAEELSSLGFSAEATAIQNAISEGRSGTEIFMQLRFFLKPLLNHPSIPENLRSNIQLLYERLNEALR